MKKKKQNAEERCFYKAWEQANNAQMLLCSALAELEKTAKAFTKEQICPTASFVDGITIKWENFDHWGLGIFFSPEDFLIACRQRKISDKRR